MRRARLQFVLPACLMAAGMARAQGTRPDDGGPIIIGEHRRDLKWFDLQSFRAALDITGRYREDRQQPPAQAQTKDTERYWLSTLDFGGESYIGHKNILDLNLDASIGYEDTDLTSESQGGDSHTRTLRYLYDVSGLFLQESPLPTTLYARHTETNSDRQFLSSFTSTTDEYGAKFLLRSKVAPSTIQVFHREQDDSDPLGSVDFSSRQDTVTVYSQLQISKSQELLVDYAYSHVNEQQFTFFDNTYDRHDATVTHYLRFGETEQHNLRSILRFYDQSGIYDQQQFRWDEQLFLRHTDDLETRYNLTYDDRETNGLGQRSLRGSATIRHQLFESLTSSLTGGAGHLEDDTNFESDEWFASAEFDYTKRVPYGRLDLGLGFGTNRQDSSDRGTTIGVLDESQIIPDPQPLVLARRNIIPSSIRITDAARTRVYIEGVDYTVTAFRDRVEIRPIIGGAIVAGQGALVSYDVGPEPANIIQTGTASASFRYSIQRGGLRGLSTYVQYRTSDQSVDSVDPSAIIIDDVHNLRFGADYRIGDFTFLAERENLDSRLAPQDRTRLEARYDRRFSRDTALNITLTSEQIDYAVDRGSLRFYRATGNWAQRLTDSLDMNLRLEYRDEADALFGDIQGFEEAIELRWKKRQTTISGSIRNTSLEGDRGDSSSLVFVFGLRREF